MTYKERNKLLRAEIEQLKKEVDELESEILRAVQMITKKALQLENQAKKIKTNLLIQGGLFFILKKAGIFPSQTDIMAAISMWKQEENIKEETPPENSDS